MQVQHRPQAPAPAVFRPKRKFYLSGNLDESLSAKQSRDTERSNTIQKVEIALVSYYNDNKSYPIDRILRECTTKSNPT